MVWRPLIVALMIGLWSYATWQFWRARRPEQPSKWVRVYLCSIRPRA